MRYGLELHETKSQILPAGQFSVQHAHRKSERIPAFHFLGFTCYWGKSRKGFWRLKYKSRRDRFAAKLKGLRKFLRKHLNTKDTKGVLQAVMRVVRGWINYHNISDNTGMVAAFRQLCMRIIFTWLNRRGRRHPMRWDQFNRKMQAMGFPKTGKTISMFPTR